MQCPQIKSTVSWLITFTCIVFSSKFLPFFSQKSTLLVLEERKRERGPFIYYYWRGKGIDQCHGFYNIFTYLLVKTCIFLSPCNEDNFKKYWFGSNGVVANGVKPGA